MWKCNLIGDADEIPMWERDELWKRNSFGEYGEIPMWNKDNCGNAIKLATLMKFQRGKEIVMEMQLNLHL